MNFYIAGPMRGIENFNYPAFNDAAMLIRAHGHDVFNPAEGEDPTKFVGTDAGPIIALRHALARDMEYIALHADAIYMLRGWETSLGARAEHALAVALKLEIFYEVRPVPAFPGEVASTVFIPFDAETHTNGLH